jgi:hypothetical protein
LVVVKVFPKEWRLSSASMRFELSHPFDAPSDKVSEAMLDPSFQETLTDIGDLHHRHILSEEGTQDGGLVRRVRCVLALQVSGMARSMLGDADPAWVQEEKWSPDRLHCDWVIHPEVGGDLLSAAGTIDLEGSDGKTTRAVAGEVKVRVPLYGGKVEGWIVQGVTRAYDEEAERVTSWLEREK